MAHGPGHRNYLVYKRSADKRGEHLGACSRSGHELDLVFLQRLVDDVPRNDERFSFVADILGFYDLSILIQYCCVNAYRTNIYTQSVHNSLIPLSVNTAGFYVNVVISI